MPRSDDRATRHLIMAVASVVLILGAAVTVLLASANKNVDETLEVAKALVSITGSVAVTGILGVVITTSLARRDHLRYQREELARLSSDALQDLKAAFEKAQVARFMLRANPTGGMLFLQAPGLLEARALLQRVQRERSVLGSPADAGAQEMLDAIGDVLQDYAAYFYELEESRELEKTRVRESSGQGVHGGHTLTEDPRFLSVRRFVADDRSSPLDQGYDKARRWLTRRLLQVDADVLD
jgi:hypothetical protein